LVNPQGALIAAGEAAQAADGSSDFSQRIRASLPMFPR
jgi:hypothetical protein